MPRATIPRARLAEALGRDLPDAELRDLLWSTKAEFDGPEGGSLVLEATADRLDLLTESGLALALAPKVGGAHGLVPIRSAPWSGPAPQLLVDPSVGGVRPAIAGAIVEAPESRPLDAGLLDEAIRFQELLHATYGAQRKRASIGIYPTDRFEFPVRVHDSTRRRRPVRSARRDRGGRRKGVLGGSPARRPLRFARRRR